MRTLTILLCGSPVRPTCGDRRIRHRRTPLKAGTAAATVAVVPRCSGPEATIRILREGRVS